MLTGPGYDEISYILYFIFLILYLIKGICGAAFGLPYFF
jgi:hypothetical protein